MYHHNSRVGQNRFAPVYDRIFGDFPAKKTVYTPYIYGSGQPYTIAIPGPIPSHSSIARVELLSSRCCTTATSLANPPGDPADTGLQGLKPKDRLFARFKS